MISLLLTVFCLTSATVVVHALGTFEVMRRSMSPRPRNHKTGLLACQIQIVQVVSFLLVLHLIECTAWAGYYYAAGLLSGLEPALYFSLASYTTVGYGDIVLPTPSRLLGPIEAAVGIVTFGWSAAIIVAAIPRILRDRLPLQRDTDENLEAFDP